MPRDPTEPSIVAAHGLRDETDSRRQLVRKDERFITETFGPMVLASGEVFDIINTKEKGELVYVKIVTDNPYASVLLELDDYRNQEPNGETSAELIYDGRTSRSENSFFAVDKGPDGGYSLIYNPMKPEAYRYKIRLQVINLIPRSNDVFGFNLNAAGRRGLPTPVTPGYVGGSAFTYPGLASASLDTIAKAMAKPVGAQPYLAENVYNQAIFDQDNLTIGAHHPYQGLAGRPIFRRDDSTVQSGNERGATTIDGETIMTAESGNALDPTSNALYNPGIKALFGTQYVGGGGADPSNFPGTPGSPSSMTITLTDITESDATSITTGVSVGDRIFVRSGDTIYFPGVVTALADVGSGTDNQITIQPGLSEIPAKVQMSTDSENFTFGTVKSEAELTPKIFIKQIIVKRKKLISYEG
jgi:hypothetical protein